MLRDAEDGLEVDIRLRDTPEGAEVAAEAVSGYLGCLGCLDVMLRQRGADHATPTRLIHDVDV